MKRTVQLCSSIALIFVCVSLFASLGIAHDLPTPSTPKTDNGLVGILPPGALANAHECWSSLQNIEGCVVEIYKSFLGGTIRPLGPACCKAIIAINEACWPKMFPFNPFFPPLIKSYCATTGGTAAATPPTTTLGSTTVKKTVG